MPSLFQLRSEHILLVQSTLLRAENKSKPNKWHPSKLQCLPKPGNSAILVFSAEKQIIQL